MRFGDFDIRKHDAVGIATADAHFVFLFADLHPWPGFLHQKSIDAFVAFGHIGLGDHNVVGCGISVGNPVFGAVEQIMITLVQGGGSLRCRIRSGLGFR